MTIRNDFKAVLKDLSPILAGFKLALIVISYFGFGSVAKWVISHWYPFTRWVWDHFCEFFTLPSFPVVVKDSLTALVFFIPLGITAIFEFCRKSENDNRALHRLLGAFFGFLFLAMICKDAIAAIADAISEINLSGGFYDIIIKFFASLDQEISSIPTLIKAIVLTSYFVAGGISLGYLYKKKGSRIIIDKYIVRASKLFIVSLVFPAVLFIFLLVFFPPEGFSVWSEVGIIISIIILLLILSIILASVAYVPKKLFITTGACVAFVTASICFEVILYFIEFIETAPT